MTLKVDGTNGVLQAYDLQILTTGFSYTFASGTQTLIIGPAGALASGTVTMPASPVDGMVITIISTQPIADLTIAANTGQGINNGGSKGLQAGGSLSYVYNLANTRWQPFNAGLPIGVGQTWQNVLGSRAVGTTYTNSTGRPILVNVDCNSTGNNTLTIGGVVVGTINSTGNRGTITGIVPSNTTYILSSGNSIALNVWAELR
jgi:hypothetical protein